MPHIRPRPRTSLTHGCVAPRPAGQRSAPARGLAQQVVARTSVRLRAGGEGQLVAPERAGVAPGVQTSSRSSYMMIAPADRSRTAPSRPRRRPARCRTARTRTRCRCGRSRTAPRRRSAGCPAPGPAPAPAARTGSAGIDPPSPWTSSRISAAGRGMPPFGSRSDVSRNSAQLVAQVSGEAQRAAGQCEYGKKCTPRQPLATGAFVRDQPGQRHRGVRGAVEPALEGDDVAAAGGGLAQLDRRLDGVGAGRAAEVHSSCGRAWPAGSMDSCASMNASFAGVGRSSPWVSRPSWSRTAATSSGWLWPSDSTPAPVRKSMNTGRRRRA